MAPLAWNDLVFAGNAGGDEFGVTGRIYALDAATGKRSGSSTPSPTAVRPRHVAEGIGREPADGWRGRGRRTRSMSSPARSTSAPAPGTDFVLELRPGTISTRMR